MEALINELKNIPRYNIYGYEDYVEYFNEETLKKDLSIDGDYILFEDLEKIIDKFKK